jgi:hypothetical protein
MIRKYKNAGLTFTPLTLDKKGRFHCPICGCLVTFDVRLVDGYRWHYWECKNCRSYNEHGHSYNGESSLGYYLSAKECFRKEVI